MAYNFTASTQKCYLINSDVPIFFLFIDLLSRLEFLKSEMTISSYCIAITTLEEVFLKLGKFTLIGLQKTDK